MNQDLPPRDRLEILILQCLSEAKGARNVKQIVIEVSRLAGIDLGQRPTISQSGKRTDLDYKLAWARTSLKKSGFVERVSPGSWRITPLGEAKLREK